jgi:hypothetical protein
MDEGAVAAVPVSATAAVAVAVAMAAAVAVRPSSVLCVCRPYDPLLPSTVVRSLRAWPTHKRAMQGKEVQAPPARRAVRRARAVRAIIIHRSSLPLSPCLSPLPLVLSLAVLCSNGYWSAMPFHPLLPPQGQSGATGGWRQQGVETAISAQLACASPWLCSPPCAQWRVPTAPLERVWRFFPFCVASSPTKPTSDASRRNLFALHAVCSEECRLVPFTVPLPPLNSSRVEGEGCTW